MLIGINGATASSDTQHLDWTGFSQGQRTAILIAIIGAVAMTVEIQGEAFTYPARITEDVDGQATSSRRRTGAPLG
ncbi:MAG: hypothetical protein JWQ81_194 [Amycolatopsis sp.]|uniref:hypothetical protein n=1 Tax=Amycolatopsis sp. TaxID=37632 RepID=UPI00262C7CCA|nr:hypothetical protein [Amycolatopsis sp.]MCU1679455.1 hypothetical protein [Amycolatopsis sp.]